jgi:glutamate formiminotransferase
MATLIECVPNFSEGRDKNKVEQIAALIRGISGVYLLDIHMDPDHNRSVITFVGTPSGIHQAAVRAVGIASTVIDLNMHRGAHPRIGAADVLPIVPLRGITLADCVPIAHGIGNDIWEQFRIPVYFYEAAALHPERRNLEAVRRGGFEKLRNLVTTDGARRPDVGEPRLHPTAGAIAVGAREVLIAFNVNLNSDDPEVAKTIARTIRTSGGGLPSLKAMGVLLESRSSGGLTGLAQVSMNLTNWKQTSVRQAFEAVEQEAAKLGVSIHSSEIVGLVPAGALKGTTAERLRWDGFSPEKILENRLAESAH